MGQGNLFSIPTGLESGGNCLPNLEFNPDVSVNYLFGFALIY
jgi:hypothetical protein